MGALGQLPAAIIVFGGTIGAVFTSFPMSQTRNIGKYFKIAFTNSPIDVNDAAQSLISYAERARREGLLSLEQLLETEPNEFIRQGMQLVIDGTDPEITRDILESNITAVENRHKAGIGIFEAAGGYAPTMGIIGTVMGLVHVLGNLSDPSALSGAIAGAFLATMYGIGTANLMWLPIASKLKSKDKYEISVMEMILDGIASIQGGENPSILKEKIKAHMKDISESQGNDRKRGNDGSEA